jgi:hypothetical protein
MKVDSGRDALDVEANRLQGELQPPGFGPMARLPPTLSANGGRSRRRRSSVFGTTRGT